jgi:hypothetical protein
MYAKGKCSTCWLYSFRLSIHSSQGVTSFNARGMHRLGTANTKSRCVKGTRHHTSVACTDSTSGIERSSTLLFINHTDHSPDTRDLSTFHYLTLGITNPQKRFSRPATITSVYILCDSFATYINKIYHYRLRKHRTRRNAYKNKGNNPKWATNSLPWKVIMSQIVQEIPTITKPKFQYIIHKFPPLYLRLSQLILSNTFHPLFLWQILILFPTS